MAVNDLEAERPVVLLDDLPWHELEQIEALKLHCRDPFLRDVERFLRRVIYQYQHMPADMIVQPHVPIPKIIRDTGNGLHVQEKVLGADGGSHIQSHAYFDQLAEEEDLRKLRLPDISYDEAETLKRYNALGELIGDIVPLRLRGVGCFMSAPWDSIAQYRGVANLLIDLAERPEFMHRMVSLLADIDLHRLQRYEELGLFDADPLDVHCTPALTKALRSGQHNGPNKLTRRDVWGRGMAQVFSSVSKRMRDEFDIKYMVKTIGQCGLSYYGCCEPLDAMIDIVEKLPNLRKISVTPWADVERAAEAINTKYVLSAKPNPALVSGAHLDGEALKKEIGKILSASAKNRCSCDIVLKDVGTCGGNPDNLIRWEQIVMDMVQG